MERGILKSEEKNYFFCVLKTLTREGVRIVVWFIFETVKKLRCCWGSRIFEKKGGGVWKGDILFRWQIYWGNGLIIGSL